MLSLGLCALLWAGQASAEQPSQATGEPAAEAVGDGALEAKIPDAAESRSVEAPRRRGGRAQTVEQITGDMWWNQAPVVEALELGADQRGAMDRVFGDYLRERRARRESPPPAEDPFRSAIVAIDLEAAERALEERGARAAQQATVNSRMIFEVLSELEPKQLEQVQKEFPKLLTARWLLSIGGEEQRDQRRRQMMQRARARRQGGLTTAGPDGPGEVKPGKATAAPIPDVPPSVETSPPSDPPG